MTKCLTMVHMHHLPSIWDRVMSPVLGLLDWAPEVDGVEVCSRAVAFGCVLIGCDGIVRLIGLSKLTFGGVTVCLDSVVLTFGSGE